MDCERLNRDRVTRDLREVRLLTDSQAKAISGFNFELTGQPEDSE